MTRKLLQGNEVCVEAAIAAGVRFFAGYPITPATEIAEGMARKLPQVDGIFIQMEDEIASMAACIGASVAGAKAMTATSGPGVSLMLENLGFAAISETPLLLVNVMRGGSSGGVIIVIIVPFLPDKGQKWLADPLSVKDRRLRV